MSTDAEVSQIQTDASIAELPVSLQNQPMRKSRYGNVKRFTAWWPLVITLAAAILLTIIYINRTYVNVVYEDAFIQVPYVGKLLGGGSFFSAWLTAPFAGEHLLLGYRLWSLINAELFGLNLKLDPVVFMMAYAFASLLIYIECRKVFRREHTIALFAAFLPLIFLNFSFVAPVLNNMTTQFVCGTSFSLFIALLLQRDFDRYRSGARQPLWLLVGTAAAILFYFLFLSGAYFPGLLFGLLGMWLVRALIEHTWFSRRLLVVAMISVASSLVYLYFMITTQAKGSETSGGIALYFEHPINTILAYFAAFAGSIIDSHTIDATSSSTVAALGAGMTGVVVFCIWLFVRTGMYRSTYLPIYCICYPVGITTAQFVGRDALVGWLGITAEWYGFQLRFAAIGVVWILIYSIVHFTHEVRNRSISVLRLSSWPFAVMVLSLFFIGACQWVGNAHQWTRAPYVKQYFALKEEALLYPAFFSNPSTLLLWPAPQEAAARSILEKYHLSSFSAGDLRQVNLATEGKLQPSGDWHSDNWVGKTGRAALVAPSPGSVTISALALSFIRRDLVSVTVDGKTVFDKVITGGTTQTFTAPITAGVNVITVVCSKAVSPASLGKGADVRQLAVHLVLTPSLS